MNNQPSFQIAPDGVDPSLIPAQTLSTGARIPGIGLGTFGSDKYSPDQVADAIVGAAAVGYRHFDCASIYGNEAQVGRALRTIVNGGVKREDLWITSKVWNDMHGQVIASCRKSLADLGHEYLDLFLVHWPFPNHHAPGVTVESRDHNAKPYIHDAYMETWAQMESLVDMGLVRAIGTSNMTIPKLDLVLRDARIKPAVNEMELHPHLQQPELYKYVVKHGITPVGYCPIGSPSRPLRDRTPDDTVDIEDPVIVRIAERLNIHPAVVCVKWAVQHGHIPIPFSVKRSQYLSTLRGVVSEPLTALEMAAIAGIDKNNRLVKGQVFLWKPNQTWEALWDVDGTITPA
jgi:diketogulonate reductase-like aldo/keto reductase